MEEIEFDSTNKKWMPFRGVQAAYLLIHKQTERFYIGSTSNLAERVQTHLTRLRKGIHPLTALQCDFNLSPEVRFVVSMVSDRDAAFQKEQEWLDEYWDTGRVYNQGRDVRTPSKGRIISDETRRKMSESHRGAFTGDRLKNHMEMIRRNNRQISVDGVKYEGIEAAARLLNIPSGTLRTRLDSRTNKFSSYVYLDEEI